MIAKRNQFNERWKFKTQWQNLRAWKVESRVQWWKLEFELENRGIGQSNWELKVRS